MRHLQDELPAVLPAEQLQKSVGEGFESCDDILTRLKLACRHPSRHFPGRFGITVRVVEDQHALHGRAVHQQRHVVARTLEGTGVVVLRDGAADHNTRATREVREGRIENQ